MTRLRSSLGVATVFLATAASAFAQQHHHPSAASAPAQPYAGQQSREIKALSAQEQQDWLEGKGSGLAKAAELNGYPGPMHVLEHAQALSLSAPQHAATAQLMDAHKAQVRTLGRQLVDAEQALDQAFRHGPPSEAQVNLLTQRVGTLQARIRAAHLQTHLAQTALLQPEQVALYQQLRGYSK